MNILVACEESQRVCTAFREKGHRAFSCDLEPCSGGHPEWHIQGDVLPLLNGRCEFTLANGQMDKQIGRWDMIIAFPPCTHLAVSGARHFKKKVADGRQREGLEFFCKFFEADCDRVAIENPVGIVSGEYSRKTFPDIAERYGLPRKPTQVIQPYYFGDPHRKTTCLWLKGLVPLSKTNVVEPTLVTYVCKNGKRTSFDEFMVKYPGESRATHRSKTFPGVAKAMADQWGGTEFPEQLNMLDYLRKEEHNG